MRNLSVCIFLTLGTSIAVGCGGDFEPGSKLTKLRLLGLRADRPFARPSEHVELELLAIDPAMRDVSYAFATCTDPNATTVDACLGALDAPFASVEIDPNAAPRFTLDVADHARALVGAAVVACPGTIESGVTSGVPVACRGVNGKLLPLDAFEIGVKRVFVREHDRNANPEITRVRWDGEDWPEGEPRSASVCSDQKTHDIDDCPKALRHRITLNAERAERGKDEHGDAFEEQLVVQVYATAGLFDHDVRIAADGDFAWVAQRSGAPESGAQKSGALESATLAFVVRDDRGGMSFTLREVELR